MKSNQKYQNVSNELDDIFKENKKTPEYIQYLGKFLPSAVFGMLVIYCLKNVFLSIAGGTICYMLILYFL